MADQKISELTDLAAAPASDDYYAIVDTSATTTKKVSHANTKLAVAFKAYNSTDLSPTADDFSKVTTDTEDFDYGSNWDLSNDRFTAPQNGVYFFGCSFTLTNFTGTDEIEIWLKKNGSTYVAHGKQNWMATPRGPANLSTILSLASGDYIEFFVYSVNSFNIASNGTSRDSWVEGYMIGTY